MSSKRFPSFDQKDSDFGVRLRAAFGDVPNKVISQKLNVGKSTVTSYMQGKIPTSDKLLDINALTGCDLNWLLTGVGVHGVRRPQGIILQGSKGGIGTSTAAVMIALSLARKGFGVLLVEDELHTCTHMLFPSKYSWNPDPDLVEEYPPETPLETPRNEYDPFFIDYYLPTKNPQLDLFIPRTWAGTVHKKKRGLRYFDLNTSEFVQRYQFVIFDVQRGEDPFYYPIGYQAFRRTGPLEHYTLEPILRNAKVIVPFDVLQSDLNNVEQTVKHVSRQKNIYYDAGFLGIFLVEQSEMDKRLLSIYESNLDELRAVFGSCILENHVPYQRELRRFPDGVDELLKGKKTKTTSLFADLTNEILERLKQPL
jgi:Bacteriophage CI repressor helix-turn-helix domain